ncbi:ATP-binding protein [candidate division KSB1 bacterium]|nr:ATP-binding protein [candidate division KSB1 bacterium]
MLYRSIIDELDQWATSKNRKPLILRGARQVGKTTAIHQFSQKFDHYIYLNLEIEAEADLFENQKTIDEIVNALFFFKNIPTKTGKVLIFIDEIQNSPRAVMMLRYFYENYPAFYLIAAGSLFEIMLENKQISFPVGRVQFLYMYPLTFKEFLLAKKENQAFEALHTVPFPDYAYSKLLSLFHEYTLIGGMPEIVSNYVELNNIIALNPVFQSLLTAYIDDISKYARNERMRNVLKHCIETAPLEAGKRIKFQGFGGSGFISKDVSEALKTLERARLLYLIYPSLSVEIPAMPQIDRSPKLQLFDTGLLNYFAGLQKYFFKYDNLHAFYRGLLAEHIVLQEIIGNNMHSAHKPVFWTREKKQSNAEVDLVIPYEDYLIPIEIKAGKTGTLRSLHQFMDLAPHHFAIRLYAAELQFQRTKTPNGKEFTLLNLPYFLAFKIPDYIQWSAERIVQSA